MRLFRHAMVQLSNGQAMIGGGDSGIVQEKIHIFTFLKRNCSIHQLDQVLLVPRYHYYSKTKIIFLDQCHT